MSLTHAKLGTLPKPDIVGPCMTNTENAGQPRLRPLNLEGASHRSLLDTSTHLRVTTPAVHDTSLATSPDLRHQLVAFVVCDKSRVTERSILCPQPSGGGPDC